MSFNSRSVARGEPKNSLNLRSNFMSVNQIQAAIYARVSTEQQIETQTIASQLAALRS